MPTSVTRKISPSPPVNSAPPAGFISIFQITGPTLSAMSISTVPPTAGVSTRRRSGSQRVNAKVLRAPSAPRIPSAAGPPCCTAVTATPMKATLDPTNSVYPEPIGPLRINCNQVDSPAATSAAKTSQDVSCSFSPAVRAITNGVIMIPARISTTVCAAMAAASGCGAFSSGS